ncbi:FadR/GntR family transcriptional regulator [Rubellimicrobium sp. CFH 75288]|uniref:FadR/GntR family transcriptional regulator n=1 Tax=Rubellimicrobium sp. CFH 75288 TaxID=2697034 RepID=UPI001411BE74|nr:FCD domain-containing protein [Rubellimicrobium sp. CFH 75288]NAZ37846.1 FCD domain-containing protein [Rubellimicrobium sp. CFH 75288]
MNRVLRTHGQPGRIAGELGQEILAGTLRPGHQLPPEPALLARMGVSRTTLREAIKILAAKGMVSARPRVGTIVRPSADWSLLDPEVLDWLFRGGDLEGALAELFDMRRMIEAEAAAAAAQMASPAQIAAMQAAYAAMEAAPSEAAALDADVAFHGAIIRASGNRFLAALAGVSETALRATVKLSVRRPGGLPYSLPQHAAVLEAIAARDPAGARTAMESLILNAQSDAVAQARASRLPAGPRPPEGRTRT